MYVKNILIQYKTHLGETTFVDGKPKNDQKNSDLKIQKSHQMAKFQVFFFWGGGGRNCIAFA